MNKREVGAFYETKAAEYLESQGYSILERNYTDGYGEIDIIAIANQTVIFVEVKYRNDDHYGDGFEAVDRRKRRHLYNTAITYVQGLTYSNLAYRFDCISFINGEINWIQNVLWGDEIGY